MIALLLALALPNLTLTPGAVRPLTTQQVCSTKWGLDRRHVSEAMKRQVADAYGMPRASIVARGKGPCCEFDHLVPRSSGGEDSVLNIWPQPWQDATFKDHEEVRLFRAVCRGDLPLAEAQRQMRGWGR